MAMGKGLLLMICCFLGAAGQCLEADDPRPTEKMLRSALDSFFHASTHFSLNMLRALNHTTDVFFSPFSVWSALMLVYLGSQRETERELQNVLGLQDMDKVLASHSYLAMQKWFSTRVSSSSSFSMLNRLFFQEDIALLRCVVDFFGNEIAYVDFYSNPDLARRGINLWVQRNTHDKIRDLLPPYSVFAYTELVVASAMHFVGSWRQPFHRYATTKKPFFLSSRKNAMVDMMITKDTFQYAISDELQCTAVELPYLGRSLTMVVLLPHTFGVDALTNSLTVARLVNLTEDMFPHEVIIHLPKFQIDRSLQLSSTLRRMGVRELLNPGNADLSGFTGRRHLQVNAVYHKAYISVNEDGTEASAATTFAVSRSSRPTRVLTFVVDRPFIFYIRENYSGSILFMGVVHNPKYPAS